VKGLRWGAVATGVLVDIAGALLSGTLLVTAVALSTGATSPEQINALFDGSPGLMGASVGLGVLFTGIGAFVAASLARGAELQHAFAVGIVSTALSFLMVFASPEGQPFWAQAISLILLIPAAFAGGLARLATRRPERTRP
jgi:hypothetical protein